MTTAQVVETSVTVNNNTPIQDYVHPDDQTQLTFEMTPGFKPFTLKNIINSKKFTDHSHQGNPDLLICLKLSFASRGKTKTIDEWPA